MTNTERPPLPILQRLLTVVIWILGLLVLVVLVGSAYESISLVARTEPDPSRRFGLLTTVVASAGVLIALLAFVRDRKKQEDERHRHVSELLLGHCTKGFDAVIASLSDKNNDRLTWLGASRTLLKVLELKSKIRTDEHKVAYELEEERARNDLYFALSLEDPKTGERTSLPPQFFYGLKDWENYESLMKRQSLHPLNR